MKIKVMEFRQRKRIGKEQIVLIFASVMVIDGNRSQKRRIEGGLVFCGSGAQIEGRLLGENMNPFEE